MLDGAWSGCGCRPRNGGGGRAPLLFGFCQVIVVYLFIKLWGVRAYGRTDACSQKNWHASIKEAVTKMVTPISRVL